MILQLFQSHGARVSGRTAAERREVMRMMEEVIRGEVIVEAQPPTCFGLVPM